jgi:ubiquinone/menaquinone biosynthesis C-methylase UbiE
MNATQRLMRVVTATVVRAPVLWRPLRGVVARNFDRLAADWDAVRVTPERLAPIAAALDEIRGEPRRILDLGTGTGAVARLAAARWPQADVLGVDVSRGMVAEARRLATSERERYEVGDASALAAADGTFDLVLMNNMIPFFDEVVRVTAPGGSVVVAFALGPRTPIYVPLERVRSQLERRGLRCRSVIETGPGEALLADRPAAS